MMMTLQREIKLLKNKVQELSQENVALREINVQFQLQNFKLQQKIKRLESSEVTYENFESELVQEQTEMIAFEETTYDPSAEYLEEDIVERPTQSPLKKIKSKPETVKPIASIKRAYEETFEDEDYISESEEKQIKLELASSLDLEQAYDSDDNGLDPRKAAQTVFKLAAERGILDRLQSIEHGKQKDSSFVNKTLDLIFDRQTLANSSTRGQKCQSKLYLPARPALDQDKLNLCRQAFSYRLRREALSTQQRDERMKSFNSYVNFKIQNARKLVKVKNEK